MISMLKDHKRVLYLMGLVAITIIGSIVLLDHEIERSSAMLLSFSVATLFYILITFILKRNKTIDLSEKWLSIESWTIIILLGILLLSSALEANATYPELSALTIVFFILLVILSFLQVRADQIRKKGYSMIRKNLILNIAFWCFVLGIGRVILVFEESNNEDLLIFISLSYFAALIFLALRWIFIQTRIIYKLKNEKAKTELLHLKSQVSPHFFFNTLNNLYGLVEQDSDKAKTLILKLSEMMRYSIYKGQKDHVSLEEEIEYLKNYVELHRMRYHKAIDLQFNVEIEQEGLKIMPLLFIILVENAFKHGVENLITAPFVHMNLSAKNNQISFEIENNFDPEERNEQKGIGLKNLKRRLEIVYKNKHTLSSSENNAIFKASLSLQLYD